MGSPDNVKGEETDVGWDFRQLVREADELYDWNSVYLGTVSASFHWSNLTRPGFKEGASIGRERHEDATHRSSIGRIEHEHVILGMMSD